MVTVQSGAAASSTVSIWYGQRRRCTWNKRTAGRATLYSKRRRTSLKMQSQNTIPCITYTPVRSRKRYRKRWCYTLCGARLPTHTLPAPPPRSVHGERGSLNPPLLPCSIFVLSTSVAAAAAVVVDALIKFVGWKGRACMDIRTPPRILEYPQGKSPIRLSPIQQQQPPATPVHGIRVKIREKSLPRSPSFYYLSARTIVRVRDDGARIQRRFHPT